MIKNCFISGDFKYIIKKGNIIREESGYVSNMILKSFFDKLKNNKKPFVYCEIGTGNTNPHHLQTALDNKIKRANVESVQNHVYKDESLNLVKYSTTFKFTFNNLNNITISELGLGSEDVLSTRALFVNSDFETIAPTITVNETLEIYYRIWLATPYDVAKIDTSKVDIISNAVLESTPISLDIKPKVLPIEIGKRSQVHDTVLSSFNAADSDNIISTADIYKRNNVNNAIRYDSNNDIYYLRTVFSNNTINSNTASKTIKSIYIPTGFGYWGISLDEPLTQEVNSVFFVDLQLNIARYTKDLNTFLKGTLN